MDSAEIEFQTNVSRKNLMKIKKTLLHLLIINNSWPIYVLFKMFDYCV